MIGYESVRKDHRKKSPSEQYRERQFQRTIRQRQLTLADITSRNRLYETFQVLRATGGLAPGIDGLTYDNFSNSEVGQIAGQLSQAIQEGRYRPHASLAVEIPKAVAGSRTLALQTVFDRVVAKALHQALSPIWEKVFLPCSFGYRPGLSIWRMLATIEAEMIRRDSWVLAHSDIRKAFDNLPIKSVVASHRRMFKDQEWDRQIYGPIVKFVKTVLQGDEPRRAVGIGTGNPYSPLALNCVLHYSTDLLFNDPSCAAYARYADNLTAGAKTVPEGEEIMNRIEESLKPVEMTLRIDPPTDLTLDSAQVFGLVVRRQDAELHYELAEASFVKLRNDLLKAHDGPDPQGTGRQILLGFAQAAGLADGLGVVASRLQDLAVDFAIGGLPQVDIRQALDRSQVRWMSVRTQVRRSLGIVQ